jgi:hypothetical protein
LDDLAAENVTIYRYSFHAGGSFVRFFPLFFFKWDKLTGINHREADSDTNIES